MALFLSGYPGVIWNAVRASLVYIQQNLNPSDVASMKPLATAFASTLQNGGAAISAYLFFSGTQANFAALSEAAALPLTLDPATNAFMQRRVTAMQSAVTAAQAMQVLPGAVALLSTGQPVIPDPGYLEFLLNFSYETAPDGLTVDTVAAQAQAEATAWTTIATAMQTQGVKFSGAALNAVQQMGMASQVVAGVVANAAIVSSADPTQVWNTLVSAPSICRAAVMTYSDPTSLAAQNTAVARYVILDTLEQVNALLTVLRNQQTGQVRLAKVRMNDNLMDIANRELGNFEAWRDIAAINGLQPPYISNTPGPNVAVPGSQLFLPPPVGQTVNTQQQQPSYLNNYLGVDLYLGPINQEMLPWTGDFQVLSGYQNLAFSLGRRLQTTLGTLIYHPDFGSRIPPEIGSITDQTIAGVLEAFTTSALLSDPRVNKVVSVNVVVRQDNAFQISATVLPNGLGESNVTVNEVFGPV